MSGTQPLLIQLEQLMRWKKSKSYYAQKLGISELELKDLLAYLKSGGNPKDKMFSSKK